MEFRVLGDVAIVVDDIPCDLGLRRRDRCLLGVLLVHIGTDVPVDRLVDLLWGACPPERPRQSIQVSVSRLRRVLTEVGAARLGFELVNRGAGYVLEGDPALVDLHRSRKLCDQARATADPKTRSELLRAAIALHRGPLLGREATDQVRGLLGRSCEETLLAATELRLVADLERGLHGELVEELGALTRDHPLRESLVELRMLALYRAGRRQEALDVYDDARQVLVDQIGLDPRPELSELYLRIQRSDPVLASRSRHAPAPAQLPPDVSNFTGREHQLLELDSHLPTVGPASGAVLITAIAGAGGVGKTALALHWAHRVQDRFRDGQLYVNLHGSSSTSAVRPIEALARFLRALGVAPERVPIDVDEAAALYRSLLADKQVLVVLDNANTPEQLRPLLPGTSGSLALVTSRSRLAGLVVRDGARRVNLDVLLPSEAVALLTRVVGRERIEAEPAATVDLAALCGHLPLALRIAGAALADNELLTIDGFCDRLRGGDRLGSLEVEGDELSSVRATIGLSYAALSPETARLFCLLGLVPGLSFTAPAAACLADVEPPQAVQLLDRLAAAHLIESQGDDRYGLHDLVRDFAREHVQPDGLAALDRLYHWYLRTAHAAAALIHPQMLRLALPGEKPGADFATHAEAITWFDAERANLVAAVLDLPPGLDPAWTWRIGDGMRGYLWLRKLILEWFDIARAGLTAAESRGDPEAQVSAHRSLCMAYASICDYVPAADHARRGLQISGDHGLVLNEPAQLANLGNILVLSGDPAAAVDAFHTALDRDQGAANRMAALVSLSEGLIELGRLGEAVDRIQAGLGLLSAVGEHPNLFASLLSGLGDAFHALGSAGPALAVLADAATVASDIGSVETVAVAHDRMARVRNLLGHHVEALEDAHTALALVSEHRIARLDAKTLCTVAETLGLLGRWEEALSRHAESVRLATERNNAFVRVECLVERAATLLRARRGAEAHVDLDKAAGEARRHGYALLEAQALDLLAQVNVAGGRVDRALDLSQRALDGHRRTGHRPGEATSLIVLGHVTGDPDLWAAARRVLDETGGTAHALVAEPLTRAAFATFLANNDA
ncbi:SARP family transcriptional regulator [Longispora fulva]|uniref:DNA-binding SARP family transcriptional activator n=1 Tax=Longispora fulva TaxID=619741 RepID=A0A8J7GZ64_9ACTN|nr:BTAD domain-containing putative transcriptional regulator [Longispora fulva]MBG6140053.1 DNA-binding SARP family transcriptional activator [Longispora fulva]GIG57569.1 SARP family transcriptional regulator [Longispora fulva]